MSDYRIGYIDGLKQAKELCITMMQSTTPRHAYHDAAASLARAIQEHIDSQGAGLRECVKCGHKWTPKLGEEPCPVCEKEKSGVVLNTMHNIQNMGDLRAFMEAHKDLPDSFPFHCASGGERPQGFVISEETIHQHTIEPNYYAPTDCPVFGKEIRKKNSIFNEGFRSFIIGK